MADTKMTTGKVRLSYAHLFTPQESQDGGNPKYNVTLLIPKADKDTHLKLLSCMQAAKAKGLERGIKLSEQFRHTLYDGDGVRNNGDPFSPECHGHYVITVSSQERPTLVYRDQSPIIEPKELYSGCYARVVLNFFPYDNKGGKGVSAGLMGIMKLSDGEPLGGNIVTSSDWDDGWRDPEEEGALETLLQKISTNGASAPVLDDFSHLLG